MKSGIEAQSPSDLKFDAIMPASLLAWMTVPAATASDSSPRGVETNKAPKEHSKQHQAVASEGREYGFKRR
ncbi:MAG: hypothetical protein EOP83_25375 [Verrucomicrobiaceae bacterium]|nr:MAG: hypothetical protein EOP83_25375 [Verrucomicrobiaceae bacterium]